MKKILALLMVLLIAMLMCVPLLAIAEAPPTTTPDDTCQAVTLEPTEAPAVVTATETAQETDPGGIDLTPLLQALVGVLALVITRYVVPWLKAHIDSAKLAKINYWYTIAVTAAEKAYGSGHGTEKLADATAYLKTKGITVDDKIIDALIQQFFASGKTDSANDTAVSTSNGTATTTTT